MEKEDNKQRSDINKLKEKDNIISEDNSTFKISGDSPMISVGILFSSKIRFSLNGKYKDAVTGEIYQGDYSITKDIAKKDDNKGNELVSYRMEHGLKKRDIELPIELVPTIPENCNFDLTEVTIGVNFHWERKENQRFMGSIKIIDEGEHLTAINIISMEDYLFSVISSEMNAESPMELLKSHAVISRSWLISQKEKAEFVKDKNYKSTFETEQETIKWYDREEHKNFDVCADDHCQRYHGITKVTTPQVKQALEETFGEVLVYDGKICDTRFSKCCGGVTELFENTWEADNAHEYLQSISDSKKPLKPMDLTSEIGARRWILSPPKVFCNTKDKKILASILTNYDNETQDFFRWKVEFTTQTLSELVVRKTGIDFGTIKEIIPIERGKSGRIIRIKIVGTKSTHIIGKELFIRKAFSESHLYSSAFIVEKQADGFIFYGAGWGHGVGLCQIGAAVMASEGYNYKQILEHYFIGSSLEKLY